METKTMTDNYQGFELGPIRLPSEAHSLLLRITRNCPWNKCKFCGLYKGEKFSIRPVDHVIREQPSLFRLSYPQPARANRAPRR